MAKKMEGACALTGEQGPFVKSHIIPSAFTPTYAPGKPPRESSEKGLDRVDGDYSLIRPTELESSLCGKLQANVITK
jgi:hypothetical protein